VRGRRLCGGRAYLEMVALPHVIVAMCRALDIDRAPAVVHGSKLRYRAEIQTPVGVKVLT
jgi:hypothetical protein